MESMQFAAGEFYQQILPGLTCAAVPLLVIGLWTVLGWLGKAVWYVGHRMDSLLDRVATERVPVSKTLELSWWIIWA